MAGPRSASRAAIVLLVTSLATPAGGLGQEVEAGAAVRLTLRGLVGTTVFGQDRLFGPGNGQNAQWAELDGTERWWLGGDARNTRLLLEVAGPRILGDWRTEGLVEADFFGGFPGAGGFAAEQPLPRLRLAYGAVARGGTAIRLGQDWSPLSGYVPESVTHVAFPLGFGAAGQIGWRFPGIFLFQDLARAEWGRLQLRAAVMRGGWDDAPDPELPTGAQLAGVPQLQTRLDAEGGDGDGVAWGLHLTGHLDRKELDGLDSAVGSASRITGWAAQLGARWSAGVLTLHGNAYAGRAIGHHAGHISQFGDIRGWGGWVQAGVALDPLWSLWSFFGNDEPRDRDLGPGDRLRNRVFAQMLRLEDGPFAVGLEWLHARTRWRPESPEDPGSLTRSGNQLALSLLFRF